MGDPLWRSSLRGDGYAVIRGAVPREMCDRVLDAISDELQIRVDDPQSWARISPDLDQVPLWGHQSQWEIRQLPNLYEVWSTIWGRRELWSDIQSCRFTPPYEPGRWDGMPIHFDVDPHDVNQQWYPGVIALTDTPCGNGGFRCVPSLFRDSASWPHSWPRSKWGIEYRPDVEGREIVEVPMAKGDLLILDSHLPHGTVRNNGHTPRAAFYLQLHPAGNAQELAERLADVDAGRCPPWWRHKPGHDRLDPQPLRLTALGRRLLGTEPW